MNKKVFAAALLVAGMATMNVNATARTAQPITASVVNFNLAKANASVTTENNRVVKYTINPGGNPTDIEMSFDGASRVYMDLSGHLVIVMKSGEFRSYRATFYQNVNGKVKPVAGNFRVLGANKAQFHVGKYDTSMPLQIDAVFGEGSNFRG